MFKNKTIWIVIAVAAVLLFWVKGVYNNMVTQDEGVKTAWSQVENQYQRRLDLIPNLVNTVKGYASHEKETLEGVIQARAQATQTTIDPSNLTEESMKRFQAAQGELSNALSRLMVVMERYPDLKANQNFLQLQEEIADIENKLAAARRFFNSTTRELNVTVQSFPTNLIAGVFGFKTEPMFEIRASERAQHEKTPEIKF